MLTPELEARIYTMTLAELDCQLQEIRAQIWSNWQRHWEDQAAGQKAVREQLQQRVDSDKMSGLGNISVSSLVSSK
jgi:hypothetical protein